MLLLPFCYNYVFLFGAFRKKTRFEKKTLLLFLRFQKEELGIYEFWTEENEPRENLNQAFSSCFALQISRVTSSQKHPRRKKSFRKSSQSKVSERKKDLSDVFCTYLQVIWDTNTHTSKHTQCTYVAPFFSLSIAQQSTIVNKQRREAP